MKRFYSRTNKVQFAHQITKQQRRVEILRRIKKQCMRAPPLTHSQAILTHSTPIPSAAHQLHASPNVSAVAYPPPCTGNKKSRATLSFEDEDPIGVSNPRAHYEVSQSTRHHIDITEWLHEHEEDPAIIVRPFGIVQLLSTLTQIHSELCSQPVGPPP